MGDALVKPDPEPEVVPSSASDPVKDEAAADAGKGGEDGEKADEEAAKDQGEGAEGQQTKEDKAPSKEATPAVDYGPEEWETMDIPNEFKPLPLLRVGWSALLPVKGSGRRLAPAPTGLE